MGFLRRALRSQKDLIDERRELATTEVRAEADDGGDMLVEIEVVGEPRQNARTDRPPKNDRRGATGPRARSAGMRR